MKTTDYLFVYGTLMRPFDTSVNRFLRDNSRFAGVATVTGRLYDLGRYPGLVLDEAAGRPITGHVYLLPNPAKVLAVLDRYEGYDPERPESGEYRREFVEAHCAQMKRTCWGYLYKQDLRHLPEIPCGNYADYVQQNTDHQHFIKSI